MDESYDAAITLWPATPLPASAARELHSVGVNLAAQKVNDGWFTARRTAEGAVVLDLSFGDCPHGLTHLEAVLATLRLARISYVAWDVKKGEIAGTGRSFDPTSGIEQQFTVMGDGEPVLTASDLEEFQGRYDTAEALLEAIHEWLRLPTPSGLTDLADGELTITIAPEETDEEDDPIEILGEVDGPPGACLQVVGCAEDR
ncbi:MAG TPA: hypothetical protein VFW38_07680 [Solirubrobacteraceae bacterium]|nr:hypothetical protein [Solirubrobacteraceae bacterium]